MRRPAALRLVLIVTGEPISKGLYQEVRLPGGRAMRRTRTS
jgi:hypothetical protein